MAANPTMKVANKIFMPLLRSPLHFLVSHGLMLITVTGRKTGKQYTTAVAYMRDEQRVVFFSNRDLLWIKNLEGGAPVMLRLRGKDLPATACQKILDTARSLLLTEGLGGISMRTLAEKADYSPAALYKYIDSKEAIVEALRQEAWQMMAAFEPEPPPAGMISLADLYVHSGRNYIRFASQYPEYYQLIMSTTETGPASLEEFKQHPNFVELLRFVEAAVAAGEFELPAGYAPIHLAMLSWFAVHGISLLNLTMMSKCQGEFEAISLEVLEMVKTVFVKK